MESNVKGLSSICFVIASSVSRVWPHAVLELRGDNLSSPGTIGIEETYISNTGTGLR